MNFLRVPAGFLFQGFLWKYFQVCGGRIPDPSPGYVFRLLRIRSGSGNVSYFYGSGSGSGSILCNAKAEGTCLYILLTNLPNVAIEVTVMILLNLWFDFQTIYIYLHSKRIYPLGLRMAGSVTEKN